MATLAQLIYPIVRQIVKTSNQQDLSNDQILGYLDQFISYDVPAQLVLFDLTAMYTFQSIPYVDKYNVPIDTYTYYNAPFLVEGIPQAWVQSPTQWTAFSNPARTLLQLGTGDGTSTAFTFNVYSNLTIPQPSFNPFVRAYYTWNKEWTPGIVLTSQDSNNVQMQVTDGWTAIDSYPPAQEQPSDFNVGYLTQTGASQCGTVDYILGNITVQFATPPGANVPIYGSFLFFQPGMPSGGYFYDNYIQLYPIPDRSYQISVLAQRKPANFMSSSDSLQFTWMAEYFARGTAQKILGYVGDLTQWQFYEPLFREQERYVLRRTSRQNATQRVYTPYANQLEAKISAPYGAWRWF